MYTVLRLQNLEIEIKKRKDGYLDLDRLKLMRYRPGSCDNYPESRSIRRPLPNCQNITPSYTPFWQPVYLTLISQSVSDTIEYAFLRFLVKKLTPQSIKLNV